MYITHVMDSFSCLRNYYEGFTWYLKIFKVMLREMIESAYNNDGKPGEVHRYSAVWHDLQYCAGYVDHYTILGTVLGTMLGHNRTQLYTIVHNIANSTQFYEIS